MGKSCATAIEYYFRALRERLPGDVGAAVEQEWRGLFAWACADFHPFLSGWAPHWRVRPHERELTREVIESI